MATADKRALGLLPRKRARPADEKCGQAVAAPASAAAPAAANGRTRKHYTKKCQVMEITFADDARGRNKTRRLKSEK
eukprot:6098452-Alexandrium_andersonii.AAC.1